MKFYIIGLLAAHFIGDWIFQSRTMALNKSKDFSVLVDHLLTVTFFLALAGAGLSFSFWTFGGLLLLNAILHGLIDWNIWRIYAKWRGNKLYEEDGKTVKHDYTFYSTIAIDQFLHLSIIFLIFL